MDIEYVLSDIPQFTMSIFESIYSIPTTIPTIILISIFIPYPYIYMYEGMNIDMSIVVGIGMDMFMYIEKNILQILTNGY